MSFLDNHLKSASLATQAKEAERRGDSLLALRLLRQAAEAECRAIDDIKNALLAVKRRISYPRDSRGRFIRRQPPEAV